MVKMLVFCDVCLRTSWHDLAFDWDMPAEPGSSYSCCAGFPPQSPQTAAAQGEAFGWGVPAGADRIRARFVCDIWNA